MPVDEPQALRTVTKQQRRGLKGEQRCPPGGHSKTPKPALFSRPKFGWPRGWHGGWVRDGCGGYVAGTWPPNWDEGKGRALEFSNVRLAVNRHSGADTKKPSMSYEGCVLSLQSVDVHT
eukprot:4989701-Prymnesium_polylepis.1